jgi:hypothetical protein
LLEVRLMPLPWLQDNMWMILLAGGLATAGAFLFGRRLLVGKSSRRGPDPKTMLDGNFLQGVLTDRRSMPRRKGSPVEVDLLIDEPAGAEPATGVAWVKDRSVGGLCLVSDHEMPPDTVMKVRPRVAQTTPPPWTVVTVKSCRRASGEFELNCQFHHTPSWNVLLLFG